MDQSTLDASHGTRFSKHLARVKGALAWRIREVLGNELVDRHIVRAAFAWRPHLKESVFIGISGSAGKTTTKELLLGLLAGKHRHAIGNPASLNMLPEVAKTILRTRPRHRYCVA